MTTSRICGVLFCVIVAASSHGNDLLKLERTIPLPGVEGRIDHLSADAQDGRLFVAALGNKSVEVIDLTAGKVVRSIGGLEEPQGVLSLQTPNRLYVATGGDGAVRIFDGSSFQLLQTVKLGSDADNIRYEAGAKRIWVGYGGGALAALDPAGRRLTDIQLTEHPESFQMEKNGPRIFVNVPRSKEVALVDREKNAVIGHWGTGLAFANFPMALDEKSRRVFIVCRTPARLLVMDTDSGKTIAKIATVADADDTFYDATLHRIYVSGGEGAVAVYAQKDADHYEELGRVQTAAGARTSLFVPELSRLFVAVPHRSQQMPAIQVYSTAGQQAEENKSRAPAQVLFVCEHGAAKSVIAATYFNKLARERGLPQRAITRGTQPDPAYSSSVVQGLKGDGLEVDKGKPTVVTDADLAAATYVVTLGCKLPHSASPTARVRTWDEVTMSEGYAAARQGIVKRVEQLLDELSRHEIR